MAPVKPPDWLRRQPPPLGPPLECRQRQPIGRRKSMNHEEPPAVPAKPPVERGSAQRHGESSARTLEGPHRNSHPLVHPLLSPRVIGWHSVMVPRPTERTRRGLVKFPLKHRTGTPHQTAHSPRRECSTAPTILRQDLRDRRDHLDHFGTRIARRHRRGHQPLSESFGLPLSDAGEG